MAEQEKRDPTKFNPNLFRKEFRENVGSLNEDAIAEYHTKVESGEIILDPPAAKQEDLPETERLEGSAKVGEMLRYKSAWYVAVESYPTTIDEGESFVSGGWETVVRKATDDEIAAHAANPTPTSPVARVQRDRRAEFLAEHGVPEGQDPKLYLTEKQLRQLSELD